MNEFPLVVSLHGVDERGIDNLLQLNRIGALIEATQSPDFASFLLAPQTPLCCQSWSPDQSNLTISLIEEIMAEYHVDPSRIYATGFSMGGVGTYALLVNRPDLFAAAAPIASGWRLPSDPLLQEDARRISHIPIWIIHGDQDEVIPIELDRVIYEALIAAGGSPRFTEIPGAGHFIVPGVYEEGDAELYPWLFSQRLVRLPGDYNENGVVDAADYTAWRDNLGAPAGTLSNDVDGGAIGQAQYDTWKANFGATLNPPPGNSAAVPEPAGWLLITLAMLLRCRSIRPDSRGNHDWEVLPC